MHRKKIEEGLEKVRVWVEQDSSSLTRDDQDHLRHVLEEVRADVSRTYEKREGPNA